MELFRKQDSRFYRYDFKVAAYGTEFYRSTKRRTGRGPEGLPLCGSHKQSKVRACWTEKLPSLQGLSTRFLGWVESAALAAQTRKYAQMSGRLLSSTTIAGMRLDHITKDIVEALRFGRSAANVNCALRTLRRMLHKAEEWNLLNKVPKFQAVAGAGRKLRLDNVAELKLLAAAQCCNWKPAMFELFRDVIILAKDTGMRNGRELYPIRRENLDWDNRIIFVPDRPSTAEE